MNHLRRALTGAIALSAVLAACPLSPARAGDLPVVYRGPGAPIAEFESPNAVRVMPGGTVVEISGSFTSAVPRNFLAVLAGASRVRTVRLESPGGSLQPALEVGRIIQSHGLDTYVGRLCASACTIAFLGGRQRLLSPNARLGFHQAHAPNQPPERFDPLLRQAYSRSGLPAAFIDHVLHTPPDALWVPNQNELRDAGVVTGEAPRDPALLETEASFAAQEAMKQLRWASRDGLLQFAAAWLDLLDQLQRADPQLCWGYLHQVPTDLALHVSRDTLGTLAAALQRVRDDVEHAPSVGIDAAERTRVLAVLFGSLPAESRNAIASARRPDGDHAAFCPALRSLLRAAMALPGADQEPALRTILSAH